MTSSTMNKMYTALALLSLFMGQLFMRGVKQQLRKGAHENISYRTAQ